MDSCRKRSRRMISSSSTTSPMHISTSISDQPLILNLLPADAIESIMSYMAVRDVPTISQADKFLRECIIRMIPNIITSDVSEEKMCYLLRKMIWREDEHAVSLLLKSGVDVNMAVVEDMGDHDSKSIFEGSTPLCVAARRGHRGIVERLIQAGANVNKIDGYGSAPLHEACYLGHVDVVYTLINAGANVNQSQEINTTSRTENNTNDHPLLCACWHGYSEVVDILIGAGADVNRINNVSRTALSTAEKGGLTKIANALLKAGAFR